MYNRIHKFLCDNKLICPIQFGFRQKYSTVHGRCSSELAELIPLSYSHGRSTHYSVRLHDFSVMILRCHKDIYVSFLLQLDLEFSAYRMLSFDYDFEQVFFVFVFLFGCPTANFGLLLRGHHHSSCFNHCIFTQLDLKVTRSLMTRLGP